MMTAGDDNRPQLDPAQILRSRQYVGLLLLGALVGVPIAVVAYFFLKFVSEAQQYLYLTLPGELGFEAPPVWWPIPLLALGGLFVALSITYLPGTSGHKPAEGFKTGGPVAPIELPGIICASLATLCFGAVLGPEAPLIAIGSGLGVLAVHLVKRDAPEMASAVIGGAGSFAAVATLLGSPLVGAFLLMEAAAVAGTMMGVVLLPGLLAAGVGALVFVGLDAWTGFGTFSLAVPDIPVFTTPTGTEFVWAIAIGVGAAVLGTAIRRLALFLQPLVEQRKLVLTPLAGVIVGLFAICFAETTDRPSSEVLFSGQEALPGLIDQAAGWSVGALVLLVVCKSFAYSVSLSCFRGGPVFPSMFIGAAAGIALSHLPGLPLIAGAAMGIGAMAAVMLGLPFTAVLLTTLFLQADAVALTPLVIVAVVVAYVAAAWLRPPAPAAVAAEAPATASR